MSEFALPCIICGKELRNELPGYSENQPSEGITATADGQYGSTVFDPMNGEFLEFNVCDPCMVTAGEQGRVWVARTNRPVTAPYLGLVGWEKVEYRPVPWHRGLPHLDEVCTIDEDDLDHLPKTIHLNLPIDNIKAGIAAGDARQVERDAMSEISTPGSPEEGPSG